MITVTIDTTQFTSRGTHNTTKKINWNDSSDRKWLMNHLHWAMTNDNSVTLTPASKESN